MALAGHGSFRTAVATKKKAPLGRKVAATRSPDSLISAAAKDLLVRQSVPVATARLGGGYTRPL